MFDILINDKFFIRELNYKKAFNYAILASLTISTDIVKIIEKRWNSILCKMENINYSVQKGVVYNENNEFIYSHCVLKYKNLMKDRDNIREVYKLVDFLHKTNNIVLCKKYSLEYWYSLSLSEIYQIEKDLERTLPIQNFITRLKASLNAIKLYTDETNYDDLFSMKLNDVVIQADKINKEYPELDLKNLIHLE